MSETLIIKADHIYIDQIMSIIKEFPLENIELIKDKPHASSKNQAFGILKNKIKDPVKWQQKLRCEVTTHPIT